MTFGDSAVIPVNSCKTYIQTITSIGLAASREEKAFPITLQICALCAIRTLNKGEEKILRKGNDRIGSVAKQTWS
jgi:hypothetical protein